MKLSVVILNYNVRYFLELCLQSVTEAIKTIDAEIIVVDNNSSDDSCIMVKNQFPNVVLIENTENYGFSKGNNIGVEKARGEFICILNPDTVIAEDTFTELLAFADSQLNLGIVGCRLIDGKGLFLPESKRNIPTPYVALKKMLGNGSEYYNACDEYSINKTDVLVGAFMFLKKKVYDSVDGFDEDYFMYGEDIDLSYRISKTYTNYYYGKLSALHFKGESTLRDKNYAKRFFGAMQIFYKKHFKRHVLFNSLVHLGIKLAFATRKTNFKKPIKPNTTQYFSDRLMETLIAQLPKPVESGSDLKAIKDNHLVVIDAKTYSYKTIIETMSSHGGNHNIAYRILSKNSNFALGSDSAIAQGEIIKF